MNEESKAKVVDPLDARLEELRAARAAREGDKAKADARLAKMREIEKEEALAKLEAEHGPVGTHLHVMETDEGVVIVKRPAPVVFKRFCDAKVQNDEERFKLVQACLVHPDRAAFAILTEKLAGVVPSLTIAINRLAGFRNEDAAGK